MSDSLAKKTFTKVSLRDCCEEVAHRVDNPAKSGFERFVGLDHLKTGETFIHNWGSTKDVTSSMKIFKAGDVIVARRNVYLRRAARADFDGVCSGDGIVLRGNPQVCLSELLPFLLNTDAFWEYVTSQADGTMSKRITVKRLLAYEFALPPLEEQRRIAEVLKAAQDAKQSLIELKLRLHLQRDSLANKVIWQDSPPLGRGTLPPQWPLPESWKLSRIGDVVTFRGGSQPPRSTFVFEETPGYVRLLQIRDYKSDDNLTFIPEETVRKRCNAEDIMIGRYGPPLFQILRGLEGAYNVALIKADPDNSAVDREYLYHFLRQSRLHDLIDHMSTRSAGQAGIEMDVLKDYPIPLPPLDDQAEIARQFSTLDDLSASTEERAANLNRVSKSILVALEGRSGS